MATNRKRGKNAEKRIAEKLNGHRVGLMGGEDVLHPLLSIEVKSRNRFVAEKWYQQATRNCPAGKIPVVAIHVTNQRQDYILLSIDDFNTIFPYYMASVRPTKEGAKLYVKLRENNALQSDSSSA